MYDLFYLINHVVPAVTIAYIAYVWIQTNAVYEYLLKWKPFSYLPFITAYKKYTETVNIDFNVWLKTNNNFISKLLSCPFCFIFWASLGTGLICGQSVFLLAFGAYVLYKLI